MAEIPTDATAENLDRALEFVTRQAGILILWKNVL